jgi:tRNA A-37 threonylcarbamoyl transferase component Bud32
MPPDSFAAFLAQSLPAQRRNVARHLLPGGDAVWVKKAGPSHGPWRYWLLDGLARLLRLDVLRPVPNPGGEAAIAQEARRLRTLAALGLRVPAVLAQQPDGLLLADLGTAGLPGQSLWDELASASHLGATAILGPWQDGLSAIGRVHAQGSYLSQAFARNLVRCADGVIGYIDFEDDPLATLPLTHCQARDWLSYLHSTAQLLADAGALQEAAVLWQEQVATASAAVQAELAHGRRRMGWMQRLPVDRRWGGDLQRLGAAARLLAMSGPG